MDDGRRRFILIIGGLVTAIVVVAGVLVLWPKDEKTAAAGPVPTIAPTTSQSTGKLVDTFLGLLSAGNGAEAGPMTDDPPAAQAAITAFGKNTAPTTMKFVRGNSASSQPGDSTVKATVSATWTLSAGNTWQYQTSLDLVRKGDQWVVKWAPSVLHPKVEAGQNLAVLGQVGQSGQPAVLGEDGKPLMTWDGSGLKPVDPKIAPLLLPGLARNSSAPGAVDGRHVAIVDAAGKEIGAPLHGTASPPASTEPVKSTLNAGISIAAQNAVAQAAKPTMLVAIRPSTGGILAVAQNDAAGTALTALNGLYQPGSSFKIATAAAAIQQAGMSLDSEVQCPPQATISSRTIRNADFGIDGPAKLRTAFARSCNTTFAEIASKLPADGLKKAANQFGLNADFDIPGITTELGKVENADSGAQRVEDSIGQGHIQASPLGMAVVTATVAAKKAVTPQLRKDSPTTVGTPYQAPPAAVLAQIRTMMGEVVTVGTATKLKGISGLAGKTGTAETSNNGSQAHGWFVGIRGDVAFAVLVKDGGSSAPALDVAGAFLRGF